MNKFGKLLRLDITVGPHHDSYFIICSIDLGVDIVISRLRHRATPCLHQR
jgi:hypothetical protein